MRATHDNRPGGAVHYVGTSSSPVERVVTHNTITPNGRGKVKKTARFAGRWNLVAIVGPFESHGATEFARVWGRTLKTVLMPEAVASIMLYYHPSRKNLKLVFCEAQQTQDKVNAEFKQHGAKYKNFSRRYAKTH